MKVATAIIRWILSIAFCWMVYEETGMWTGIFAILILISLEANTYAIELLNRRINALDEAHIDNLKTTITNIISGFGTKEERESAARAVGDASNDGRGIV